jgi:hypothetical protein
MWLLRRDSWMGAYCVFDDEMAPWLEYGSS